MAVVFSESFDGGTDGAAITDTNTAYDNVVESGTGTAVFDDSESILGTSALITANAGGDSMAFQSDFTARTESHRRYYYWLNTFPPSNESLAFIRTGTEAIAAEMQVRTDGRLRMRDSFVAVATANTAVSTGEWFSVEWDVDAGAGTQQLQIFRGANLHGTTPDETVPSTYDGGSFDGFREGMPSAPSGPWSLRLDEVVDDDAVSPGPAVTPDVTARIHESRLVLPQAATATARIHGVRLVLPPSSVGSTLDGSIWAVAGGTLHPFVIYQAHDGQLVQF